MTAVAPPVQLQQPSRTGWNPVNGGQNGFTNMSQEEVGKMFMPGPRKTAQRTNSSSSLSSNSSSTSTISASSVTANGNISGNDWARKKTTRGIWPPGKSEPTSGLSTARPQSVSSVSSGPTAASAISALHGPLLPSQQQLPNGQVQQNGAQRNGAPPEGSAFLYLLPMNGTFERKTIHVPYYPDVLRIGRQTNAKTAPTPTNGYFDSKVLSRQHAEVYAERNGRIFIRDVKSSNGTFVNGKRLSPENKESEPHELREQDVLELGIDIVSEDQKTVVHHKVAARVEHAGGHPGLPSIKTVGPITGPVSAIRDPNAFQQPPWSRMWVQPISTEQIVKRLNRELNLAKQQQQDIARAKQSLDHLMKGESRMSPVVDEKTNIEHKPQSSPRKNRPDVNQFPEPPAPPPSQPLPEKPDISKALNDPTLQPLLQRSDTAKPSMFDSSDHSNALFILTRELKAAKDQIPSLQDRVVLLEQQLEKERLARVNAEERAYQLEHGPRKDSAEPNGADIDLSSPPGTGPATDMNKAAFSMSDLQSQLDRLQTNMFDMKQQMEEYKRRAESAESQRDEVRQTLEEMIEEKRTAMSHNTPSDTSRNLPDADPCEKSEVNGHTIRPFGHGKQSRAIPIAALLEQAGLGLKNEEGAMITRQQAAKLQGVLRREGLVEEGADWEAVRYHGLPGAAALGTVVLGLVVMRWLNGWEAVKR
ncbi:VPS64-like protein [Elsinoe fawcettii]|nr:VPS64-like protein [Elsinoe fawcettii]